MKVAEKLGRPRPPFTTSTLQQTAANRFGFTARKTMQIAQSLYEGVNIGSERLGLITYMRTDSTRIAESALAEVREYIGKEFPGELPEAPIVYAAGKGAQDAHEAIRPTYVTRTPAELKKHLTSEEFRLYSIIWERFVSSQMNPSKASTTTVDIQAGRLHLPGLQHARRGEGLPEGPRAARLQGADQGAAGACDGRGRWSCSSSTPSSISPRGRPRYTDATIVKTLEEKGIGRPSTYAPIISVLLDRYYVVRKSRQLIPDDPGQDHQRHADKSFPELLDPNFTAAMEQKLDEVEEGKSDWQTMIRDFYGPFQGKVASVQETLESVKGVMDEKTDVVCDVCGRPDGEEARPLRVLPRLHGLSRVQEHEARAPGPLSAPGLRRADRGAQAQARQGPRVLRLHELPHLRLRDLLQADRLEVPEVRLVPRGEGGQAARAPTSPASTPPATTCIRRRRMTRVREDYLTYLGAVRNLSPHTLESYGKDLEKYEAYLRERGVEPERGRRSRMRGASWAG